MGDMENRRHFRKIVVTGGPCAGKTTGLDLDPEYF